jgi:hypothetical protein
LRAADHLRLERRLAAILAADVVGYSRLMSADEEGTHLRLLAYRREVIAPKGPRAPWPHRSRRKAAEKHRRSRRMSSRLLPQREARPRFAPSPGAALAHPKIAVMGW